MAVYRLTGPDGSQYDLTAPDNATPDQVQQVAHQHIAAIVPQQAAAPSAPDKTERVERGLKDAYAGTKQLGVRYLTASPILEAISSQLPKLGLPDVYADRDAWLDKESAENKKAVDEYDARQGPGTDIYRMAGQLAGTAPLALIPGVGEGMTGAIATGALQGGLGGALTASGENKDVTTGALSGAATGGVLGAAGKVITNGVSGLIRNLSSKFPGSLQDAAVQKVLNRIAADQKAGGPSAQDITDAVNAARAAGKPMSVADVGGENVRGLAGYVARQPGEGRQIAQSALMDRDAGAGARVASDIDSGISNGSATDTAHALMDTRATAAKPLYDAAFDANPAIKSDAVVKILQTPAGQKALSAAQSKMANDMSDAGDPEMNLRTLDYVKRSLDDQIGVAQRAGEKDQARILSTLKGKLVDALDEADTTGKYAQARAAYAGPSQSLDALDTGASILRKTPAEISQEIGSLNPSDKEFYRLGAANALKQVVAKTGAAGDEARRIVGNDYVKQQLRPLFDSDEDFGRFVDSVGHETTMLKTKNQILGGSQTAGRMAEDQSDDLGTMAAGARGIAHLSTGHVLGAAIEAARMKKLLGLRSNPELNANIAKILFDQGPKPMGLSAAASATPPSAGEGLLGELVGKSAPIAGGLLPSIESTQSSQP